MRPKTAPLPGIKMASTPPLKGTGAIVRPIRLAGCANGWLDIQAAKTSSGPQFFKRGCKTYAIMTPLRLWQGHTILTSPRLLQGT